MKTELDLSTQMSEVIRPENEYREIFRNRMERLEKLSPVGEARGRVQECIELTKACDSCANRLKVLLLRLIETVETASGGLGVLERMEADHLSWLRKQGLSGSQFNSHNKNFIRAKSFLGDTMATSSPHTEETLQQAFDRSFADAEPLDRWEIQNTVELGVIAIQTYNDSLKLVQIQCDLIEIYRGMLYSLIMKKEGGELAMKAFREKTKETFSQGGAMAADAVPFAGFAFALFELYSTWKEDRELKYLENWAAVSRYFEIYPELLRRWLVAANALHSACDPLVERTEPQPA